MRVVRNEDGVALVVSLMFTLISLGMILMLLQVVLSGSRMTGAQARYKSALEASYGGTDFVTKTLIPPLFENYSSGPGSFALAVAGLQTKYGGSDKLSLSFPSGDLLKNKMNHAPGANGWGGGANAMNPNPKILPDIVFSLKGQSGSNEFKVYSKIIDTVPGVGLLDTSGVDYLDPGIGVAGSGASTQSPRTPNIYSIEVQGEKAVNPKEKANLSVLYAY